MDPTDGRRTQSVRPTANSSHCVPMHFHRAPASVVLVLSIASRTDMLVGKLE